MSGPGEDLEVGFGVELGQVELELRARVTGEVNVAHSIHFLQGFKSRRHRLAPFPLLVVSGFKAHDVTVHVDAAFGSSRALSPFGVETRDFTSRRPTCSTSHG